MPNKTWCRTKETPFPPPPRFFCQYPAAWFGHGRSGIDEAQFFDENLIDVCNELANRGTRVIVAGLDLDFKGVPFGPMPGLCAVADEVTKVHAICVRCGALAYVSHRTVDDEKRVLLGEQTAYEPLCRACYQKAIEKDNLKHQV